MHTVWWFNGARFVAQCIKKETQCALLITLHNPTTWFHMKIVAASATAQRQWREHFGFLDTKIYIWMHGNGKFAISICAPSEKMWRQALHPIQTYRLLYCIEFFSLPVSSFFRATIKRQKMHWQFFLNIVHGFCSDFFLFAQSMLSTWTRSFWNGVCGGKESEIVGKGAKNTNVLTIVETVKWMWKRMKEVKKRWWKVATRRKNVEKRWKCAKENAMKTERVRRRRGKNW